MHTNTKPGDRVNIGAKGSDNPPLSDVVKRVLPGCIVTEHGLKFDIITGQEIHEWRMGDAYATPAPAREAIQ